MLVSVCFCASNSRWTEILFVLSFSAPEVDRLDTYLMALSALQNGYKLNIIGPKRQDFFDTIGSMDRLWAYKDFGVQISCAL
jgi:hypothetical protein